MPRKRKKSRIFPLIAISALVIGALYFVWQSRPGYSIEPGTRTVEDAYQYRQTGIMAEVTGSVVRVLSLDENDPGLQKFIIRLGNGQSILVEHRHGGDERVPVSINDTVLVRGEYQWSETGGIIHHTERDLSTQRRHGWIELQGKRYN